MTLDQAIFYTVTHDADYATNLPGGLVPRGGLGRDGVAADPAYPFAQYGFDTSPSSPDTRETSPGTVLGVARLYVYDAPGSWRRIREVHAWLRTLLVAMSGSTVDDDTFVTDVRWMGYGPEMYDKVMNRNVVISTFRMVGRL